MDQCFLRLHQQMSCAVDGYDFLMDYPNSKIAPEREIIDTVLAKRLSLPICESTELYAHGECAVYSEGTMTLFTHLGYKAELVALIEHGVPIHFLVETEHNGQTLYVDAYGAFDSIEPIKSRYANNSVQGVAKLDTTEDSELVEVWRAKTLAIMDEFDDERITDANNCHFTDIYDDFTIAIVCTNFASIYRSAFG